MAKLAIVTYPQKILKRRAEAILQITPEIKNLVSQMIETMHANQGIGLAAPQVGISKTIIIVETSANPRKATLGPRSSRTRAFLNPRIVKKSKNTSIEEEGCLSLPGIFVQVKRSEKIELACQTPEGKKIKVDAGGLTARIFQHEIDHLNGKLIIDYLNPFKRFKLRKQLKELDHKSI